MIHSKGLACDTNAYFEEFPKDYVFDDLEKLESPWANCVELQKNFVKKLNVGYIYKWVSQWKVSFPTNSPHTSSFPPKLDFISFIFYFQEIMCSFDFQLGSLAHEPLSGANVGIIPFLIAIQTKNSRKENHFNGDRECVDWRILLKN